jgi:hypothetical protein
MLKVPGSALFQSGADWGVFVWMRAMRDYAR